MPVSLTGDVQRRAGRRPTRSASVTRTTTSPFVGELDGVADDVEQHLAQAAGVADEQARHVARRCRTASSRPFSAARRRQQPRRVADHLAHVERRRVRARAACASIFEKSRTSLTTARSDFARGLARSRGSRAVAACSRVSSASDVMPRIALSGVRISWLMLARNALFVSVASSARRLADLELLHELRQPRRLILEHPLGGLALGDVVRDGVDDLMLRKRRRRPEQPADGAVLVEIAILELDDGAAAAEPACGRDRRRRDRRDGRSPCTAARAAPASV